MTTLLLTAAAVSYSAGGYAMKLSDGLTRFAPGLAMLVLIGIGAAFQAVAMRGASLTVTYIAVLGLEAVAALALGAIVLHEGVSPARLGGVALVLAGIAVLYLSELG